MGGQHAGALGATPEDHPGAHGQLRRGPSRRRHRQRRRTDGPAAQWRAPPHRAGAGGHRPGEEDLGLPHRSALHDPQQPGPPFVRLRRRHPGPVRALEQLEGGAAHRGATGPDAAAHRVGHARPAQADGRPARQQGVHRHAHRRLRVGLDRSRSAHHHLRGSALRGCRPWSRPAVVGRAERLPAHHRWRRGEGGRRLRGRWQLPRRRHRRRRGHQPTGVPRSVRLERRGSRVQRSRRRCAAIA